MSLPNELQRHLVGDHRAKGVASKIEWSRGLMNEHRGDVTRGDLTNGVGVTSLWSPAKTQKGTVRSHMHSEAMQVHHVAADSMNTEEWRTMTERLKGHDGIHFRSQRFVSGEHLRQPSDGQTTGQDVNGEVSTEPSFDGSEQANQRKRITSKVEKVGSDTNR